MLLLGLPLLKQNFILYGECAEQISHIFITEIFPDTCFNTTVPFYKSRLTNDSIIVHQYKKMDTPEKLYFSDINMK